MSRLHKSSDGPLLCYVTDRRSFSSTDSLQARELLLSKMAAAAAAGVHLIQIREKDLGGRDCSLLVRESLQCVAKSPSRNSAPTRVLVNDRLDVALAERADGVHLGENSLLLAEAKRIADAYAQSMEFLTGVSCHSLENAKSAAGDGADYLFFGPVFATPSKAAFGAPQGLKRLAEVCRAVSIPVLAIGGIKVVNAATCLTEGASGIAAISLFQEATNMSSIVQSIRKLKP